MPISSRNSFLADMHAAATINAVEPATSSKQALAWSRYESISGQSPLLQTLTSTTSPNSNESRFLEPSLMQSAMADSILSDLLYLNQIPVEPPSIAWHRPSAWQLHPTHVLTKMENLHFFYNDNTEATEN
jgi:hypothetical protein